MDRVGFTIFVVNVLMFSQGIKAVQTLNSSHRGHQVHGLYHSTSLHSVQENVWYTLITAGQLLTPLETPHPELCPAEPIVSNGLYSIMDALMDTDTYDGSRIHTAGSGNPLLMIVDSSGIFNMEVISCVCPNRGEQDEQLL